MTDKGEKKKPAEKPVSLAPLKFEEAVKGLLRVKPTENKDGGKIPARESDQN